MATYDYDIAVIGGGSRGIDGNSRSRPCRGQNPAHGQGSALGGDCLHYGCVPSKTLIRTAQVYHQMKNAPSYGLPDMSVPKLDFRRVRERIQRVIAKIQPHDSPERFCELGVEVEFGRAEFTDEHQVCIHTSAGKTRRVSAKTFVPATGSTAAVPEVQGLQQTPYLTNREIFSLEEPPLLPGNPRRRPDRRGNGPGLCATGLQGAGHPAQHTDPLPGGSGHGRAGPGPSGAGEGHLSSGH